MSGRPPARQRRPAQRGQHGGRPATASLPPCAGSPDRAQAAPQRSDARLVTVTRGLADPSAAIDHGGMSSNPGRGPAISAHRGGSEHGPGGTYEAYRNALAIGADYVEFDVRQTR